MSYNSPRKHLLQSLSLVEDILHRRSREGQPLSDKEYEAMQHLCQMAPRQSHQPPLVGSTASSNNQLTVNPAAVHSSTTPRATIVNDPSSSDSMLTSSGSSLGLTRTDSTFQSPQARSAVNKLKRALGLGSALAMSELLARSKDEVSGLVNFAMTCSALTSQPVKLIQQLVDHVSKLFNSRGGTSSGGTSPTSGDGGAGNNHNSVASAAAAAAAAAEGGGAGGKSNISVVAMILETEFLIDPVNQTMVANNGRIARLFLQDRKSDAVWENGSLYIAIAAEGEVYGFVQIQGIGNDPKDVPENKKNLTMATCAVAALTLRTSWQLEDLDFQQRKQSLLLRIANSIAGDAFASETEVLTRLVSKSKDLVDAGQSFFFKIEHGGNEMHLLSRNELLRLEKLESQGTSLFVVADGSLNTLSGGGGGGGLTHSASNVMQLGNLDEDALSEEAQLASHAAEHIARTAQVMQLQRDSAETSNNFVEVDAAGASRQPGRRGSVHSGGSAPTTNAGARVSRLTGSSRSSRGVQLELPFHLSKTHSIRNILGIPILNDESTVIGVLILCNKSPKRSYGRLEVPQLFEQRDTDVVLQLSTLASIALANCRASSKLKSEKRRREAVLSVVAHLNEADITNVDEICKYVMHGARKLLNADRSTLFLIDEEYDELYSAVADSVGKVIRFPVGKGIAGRCALTGQAEVIADAYKDDRFNQAIDKQTGYRTLSILTLPVYSKNNVVAVAQLINKLDQKGNPIAFTSEDQDTLRTFVMFAGIAIGNSKLLEFTVKAGQEAMALTTNMDGTMSELGNGSLARSTTISNMGMATNVRPIPHDDIQRVQQALEALKKLREEDNGQNSKRFDPTSLDFDLFALREEAPDAPIARDYATAAVVELFEAASFDRIFKVDRTVIICFALQCRKMYRLVPYHNWFHAVDVTQAVYSFMFHGGVRSLITEMEAFVMLVTALVHDLDHMGMNNSYHLKTDSPLGILSSVSGNNSVLEVHHCNLAITILSGPDCNVFANLDKEVSPLAYREMLQCVLATDMAKHGDLLNQYIQMCKDGFDKNNDAHRLLVMQVLMKSADINNITRSFEISRQWAVAVTEEFYKQGDALKNKGCQVDAMFDRTLGTELAKGQLGFIGFVGEKFFSGLIEGDGLFKGMQYALDQMRDNKKTWTELLNKEQS